MLSTHTAGPFTTDYGSAVVGSMRLSVPAWIVEGILLGAGVIATVLAVQSTMNGGSYSGFGVALLPLLGPVIAVCGFEPERRRAMEILTGAFEGSIVNAPPPG